MVSFFVVETRVKASGLVKLPITSGSGNVSTDLLEKYIIHSIYCTVSVVYSILF